MRVPAHKRARASKRAAVAAVRETRNRKVDASCCGCAYRRVAAVREVGVCEVGGVVRVREGEVAVREGEVGRSPQHSGVAYSSGVTLGVRLCGARLCGAGASLCDASPRGVSLRKGLAVCTGNPPLAFKDLNPFLKPTNMGLSSCFRLL
jgi:hypothetical protein